MMLDEEDLSDSAWEAWNQDASKRALDDLFSNAAKYRTSESYRELLQFITRFHSYAPFNAMLVHVQKPGAKYVLPAHKWMKRYKRTIKPGAQALVILQPMGPVMFVFDVSETEGAALPPEIENPFALKAGKVSGELAKTIHNAKRDGIRVTQPAHGSQLAGSICCTQLKDGELEFGKAQVPLRYELLLNINHDESVRYSTLVHELAHLYCGHLGTPHPKWWPDRRGLPLDVREFEAESVCFLVCQRIGLETKSDEYLAGYYSENKEVPSISLERVLVSARLIEEMGQRTLPVRKEAA